MLYSQKKKIMKSKIIIYYATLLSDDNLIKIINELPQKIFHSANAVIFSNIKV